MTIKTLKLISRFAMVLIVLSIIPSGAFASENGAQTNSADQSYDLRSGPAGNITDENFTDVQENILDSVSKKITELQSFYTNVSEASSASDLQKVLSSHRPTNECMGPDGMNRGPGEMHMGPGRMPGLSGLDRVENVTDDNFTDVQTEIVESLGNMTQRLETEQTNLTEAGDDNRTEELSERIADLQNLSTNVSEASTAAELQEVVFTYMKSEAVDSLEKEVEHLQAKVSESENTSDELSSRITELTSLIENVNGAESLEDLKEIMFSSRGTPGVDAGEGPRSHGGHGGCDCLFDRPGKMQDNSTDNSTEA